jgi:predicted PurR-regulated permease PerM
MIGYMTGGPTRLGTEERSSMSRTTIQTFSFIALVVVITAAFLWLLLPFYGAILWAVILAILFNPVQRRLVVRLGGRRNVAAALSVLACIAIAVIPASLILASLAIEAASVYRRISASEVDLSQIVAQVQGVMPDFILDAFAALNLGSLAEIQERLLSMLSQTSQILAAGALGFGQGTVQILISLAVMLYLLFFLFRDGKSLAYRVRKAIPLDDRRTDHIVSKFVSVVKATVRGNVVIAVIQGSLGGVTFWLLGIEAPLLWGVVMAVLSLLPAVGAFLVWAPFAAYLLLTGDYTRGIILLAVGALVISTIDNLLRPILVGRETRLPDYVVLISTLGGLSLIGMNGFVLGPLIAALFIAVWSLFTDDRLHPLDDNPPGEQ